VIWTAAFAKDCKSEEELTASSVARGRSHHCSSSGRSAYSGLMPAPRITLLYFDFVADWRFKFGERHGHSNAARIE
jgi:hypothetical protein